MGTVVSVNKKKKKVVHCYVSYNFVKGEFSGFGAANVKLNTKIKDNDMVLDIAEVINSNNGNDKTIVMTWRYYD